MKQLGFLDFDIRLNRIDKAGAKGVDVVLLFKILILQSLYNLFDEALEY